MYVETFGTNSEHASRTSHSEMLSMKWVHAYSHVNQNQKSEKILTKLDKIIHKFSFETLKDFCGDFLVFFSIFRC